jgi:hypothetical protein
LRLYCRSALERIVFHLYRVLFAEPSRFTHQRPRRTCIYPHACSGSCDTLFSRKLLRHRPLPQSLRPPTILHLLCRGL